MSIKQRRTVRSQFHVVYLQFLIFFIGFKIIGVSPECMVLATLFTSNKGAPYPCANNCLQYDNLSDVDTKKLKDTVQSLLG